MSYLKATERKILKDLAILYSYPLLAISKLRKGSSWTHAYTHTQIIYSYLAVSWGSILPTGFDGLP